MDGMQCFTDSSAGAQDNDDLLFEVGLNPDSTVHSHTYPVTLIIEYHDGSIRYKNTLLFSVFSYTHQFGNSTSCPLFNAIIA